MIIEGPRLNDPAIDSPYTCKWCLAQVTFHLDKDSVLTVTARDLDTQRQKQWSQRGEVCELAGQE